MTPTPPPLPPASSPLTLDQLMAEPVMLGGQPIPGTRGMTLGDLELDVLKGGRFVTFAWNVSVVVLSFRNSTRLLSTCPRTEKPAAMRSAGASSRCCSAGGVFPGG